MFTLRVWADGGAQQICPKRPSKSEIPTNWMDALVISTFTLAFTPVLRDHRRGHLL